MNQYIQINLMKGLDLRVSVSGDISRTNQDSFMPKEFDSNTPARDNGKFRQSEGQTFLNENTLSYNGKFKSHRLNVVLGQSLQQDKTETITLNGNGYIDKSVITIQNASTYTNISRSESERALLSFFGRVSYDWKGRYLASATIRNDGSSRFGKNKRFGTFPSVSMGWRFSDEKFMNFAKGFLRDAKIRGSIGVTGNQTISNYAALGSYTASSNKYDGNVEILYNAMPNDIIGWEKTTQYNIGLDLSFFKGRVVFNADAYVKKTKDLLFDFPVSYYTGFSAVPRNYGSVENKGLEFLLETVNLTGRFKWKTSFNISMNRNKITELPNNEDIIIGNFSLGRVGEPMGVFYAHRALGVYSKDEDNVYILPNGQKDQIRKGASTGDPFKGGDMIWEDIDGNGVIDDNDRVIIGDPNPKFIGGMSNTFSYKGISLNIMMQWSYGNKVMNEFRRTRNAMRTTGNLGQDALARWKAQGDITNFPMIRYQDKMENFRPSSFNMEDGSFLRIKEVTLSYNIPRKWCKKAFLKSANVYISGTNLLTWSKYSGYDPEVNTATSAFIRGVDNGAFPKSRSYNLGVNLTF
ncbi:SusC/RagA family TonB-linked outer membrane protein [Bacteroides ovatus]|nr:SusC/RagA family TonB-linked outer membrane protein [Bacteroides ovatus]